MRCRTLAVAWCALMLACGGSAPTSPTPAPSPVPSPSPPVPARTFTLIGHVFASDTGMPLPGANIYILQGTNRGGYTQSDAQGTFTLSTLQPGTFTLEVVPQQVYNVVQQEVVLTADTSLNFALTPRVPRVFVLSGRVTDISSGAPIPGASITILDGDSASRTTTSGGDGTFVLADLIFGGFTVRVRHDGYDSVFQGVRLVADTALNILMRRERETLAGTWTGTYTATSGSSAPVTTPIAELTVTHAGAAIASNFLFGTFTGTLQNPSAIAATTEVTGTMTLFVSSGGRSTTTCTGTGRFNGVVSWTRLVIVAPQVIFDCGDAFTNVTLSLVRQQ